MLLLTIGATNNMRFTMANSRSYKAILTITAIAYEPYELYYC